MPKPKEGESKDEFMSRCMRYDDMQKYEPDQRVAICFGYWEEKKEKTMRELDKNKVTIEEVEGDPFKIVEERMSHIKVGDKVQVPGWDPNQGEFDDFTNSHLAKVISIRGNKVQVRYLDDGEITTLEIGEVKKIEEGIYLDTFKNTKVDYYLQKNADRMDPETIIGDLMDKFQMGYDTAEELVMDYGRVHGKWGMREDVTKKNTSKRKIGEKSKPIDIGYGQLVGIGRDSNGNKVAKFKTNKGKSFSIQTNNNLPSLHKETDLKDVDKSKAEKEVLNYIKKYGTDTQKQMLPESKIKEKFGYLDGKTVQLKSNTIVTDVDHNKKRMIMDTYVDVEEYPNYPSDYIIKGLNSGEIFQVRKSEFDSIINQGGGRILENYNGDIDEEDAFIVDKPRGGYDVSIGGKFIGNFDDLDDVEKALRIWMKKNNWYPAVWFVDDHGGVDMYTLDEKNRNKKDIIEVSAPFKVGSALIEKGDRIRILQEEMFKGDNAYRFNDEIAAKEIELYLENDEDLYRQQFLPIIENIKRKMKSGRYDHSLAPKLWMYFVDNGVKKYIKEFGSPGNRIDTILTKKDRMTLAQKLADCYYDEIMEGNYEDI